jgi:hypothetical protein
LNFKVQFSADIRALPAVDLSERIEELERGMDALQDRLDTANKARADANFRANKNQFKLAEAMGSLREIITRWDTPAWKDAEATGSVINRARTKLAELEGQ